MNDANNFLSQPVTLTPATSVDANNALQFESPDSASETKIALQSPSFFQSTSSFDSSSLDIILIQDAKTPIPYVSPMESDVDCACE